MAPSPSAEKVELGRAAGPAAGDLRLGPEDERTLLAVARRSIEEGLEHERPWVPDPERYAPPLRALRATFVTLRRKGRLRGCTGVLTAVRPLVVDVAHNAFQTAFHDPRFEPLRPEELEGLEVHISILSPPEPIPAASEDELVAALRPGRDGLILEDPPYRATFLPAVWEQVRDPREFVRELKRKAGLAPDHWSPRMRALRYSVRSVPSEASER